MHLKSYVTFIAHLSESFSKGIIYLFTILILSACHGNDVNYELFIDLKACISVNPECKQELIYDYQPNQLAGCLIFLSEDELDSTRIQQARFGFSVSDTGLNWLTPPTLKDSFAQQLSAQLIFLDPEISTAVQSCDDPRILPDLNCTQSEICRLKMVEGGLALNDQLKIDFKTDICRYSYGQSAAGYESCMSGKTDQACTIGQGICESNGIMVVDAKDPSKAMCNAMIIEPKTETCVKNELDDDCDGKVDEESGMVGQRCTLADGCANRGVLGCNVDRIECSLVNDFDMDEKECDLIDADCDGKIDENYQKQPTICETGCSPQGYTICTNEGLKNTCVSAASGEMDLCDGIDNDCDQSTDEDAIASRFTDCGVGVCASQGESRCVMGEIQVISECMPDESKKEIELCDDLDNDCDGTVDNGFDKNTDLMNCGTCGKLCQGMYPHAKFQCVMGECRFDGCEIGFASFDQEQQDCTCMIKPEACNGVDDDCDQNADEDLIAPISINQQGECLGSYQICDLSVGFREPTAMERSLQNPYYLMQESCDGRDNDCDGRYDENFQTESAGLMGVCANATKKCVDGRLVAVTPTEVIGYTVTEACDGLDNNCNGVIDEPQSLVLGLAENQNGVCQGTQKICDQGRLREPNTQDLANIRSYNQVESCDGLDNNCNGLIDDSYEPKILYMETAGVCIGKLYKICTGSMGAAFYRNPNPMEIQQQMMGVDSYHQNDTCDHLDNDCDSRIDENPDTPGNSPCP